EMGVVEASGSPDPGQNSETQRQRHTTRSLLVRPQPILCAEVWRWYLGGSAAKLCTVHRCTFAARCWYPYTPGTAEGRCCSCSLQPSTPWLSLAPLLPNSIWIDTGSFSDNHMVWDQTMFCRSWYRTVSYGLG